MTRKLFLALALFLLPACRSADPYDPNDPRPQGALLEVVNQNFYDMDVYAIASGLATRIGMATGNSTVRFALSESVRGATDLAIVATPVGGNGRASTGQVHAAPGETIVFTIGQSLRQSTVSIR